MLGIHPEYRNRGIGFALKRAQWQMVRKQGIDHVTWTYDPLLSRNAHLNVTKLGAVCNTYHRSEYGEMRDGLNAGLPSDRFQVDWWVYSPRVVRRLGRSPRPALGLNAFLDAGVKPIYSLKTDTLGGLCPPGTFNLPDARIILMEIPSDFQALKAADMTLAREWRFFSREVFETCFAAGFLVTDFLYDRSRSLYVLAHGQSTLEE